MQICLVVPTIDSAPRIARALEGLLSQAAACPPSWSIALLVCVNGARGAAATEAAVERFGREHPAVPVEVLREPRPGKNEAMSATLSLLRARPSPPDLVFFFDDDVRLDPGTLRRNVEALLAHEAASEPGPALVGAALRALPLSWREARRRHRAPPLALRAWLLHQIFAFPYRDGAPLPRFCEGMALGARLCHFPPLPPSDSGVGDDTFLSNTFALLGRDAGGAPAANLLKPPGSVGRVEISDDLSTWRQQQIRTHLGVELSLRRFGPDRAFLARCFAWPFAFTPDARLPFRPRTLADAIRYRLYMALHDQNRARALELLAQGRLPPWCRGEVGLDG